MAENTEHRAGPGQDNGLYSYDSFDKKSHPNNSRFLWWCAGAHQQLLKQFPSEYSKYGGLGGVILATFVLAALSSGYAIYSVFGSWLWTIGFAIIWGLIIFNFDRFLVSTMRKYGVTKRKQVWMALPRLALAFLIGITIARPLELKIFEKEINVKMTENIHKKIERNDSLLTIESKALIQNTTAERQRLTDRKFAIEDSLNKLQSAYVQEADGTGGSGQRGIKELTHLKMDAYNKARIQYGPELVQLNLDITQQDSILNGAKAEMEAKRKKYELSVINNAGFLERNKALSDLANEESSVFWSSILVSLLIILIEIGPVLSKLIMPVGPYDIALAKEELLRMASDENDMRRDKEILFEKKKTFFQKQKEMSEELVNKLTTLQRKHIDEELEKWERGEWNPKDHRASMDEVMRKIKSQYQFGEENIL
jgi:hypothetical protein